MAVGPGKQQSAHIALSAMVYLKVVSVKSWTQQSGMSFPTLIMILWPYDTKQEITSIFFLSYYKFFLR